MSGRKRSSKAFAEAKQFIPGGVNSPVRAFQGVGGDPLYFQSGSGARVTDIDGNSYIDYVGSWGCMILGHSSPEVAEAVKSQATRAMGFGAPTLQETSLARKLNTHMPGMEAVRLVNSGTEATMSALRLARGFTGRNLVVKFQGCYHGHVDSLLLGAGSGVLTLGIPGSPGVPTGVVQDTLNLEYNSIEELEQVFAAHGTRIAAVIIEPIAGNMGCIPATEEFLSRLRQLTQDNGALLIFDEVISGFRVGLGGASQRFRITPDICTLGKIIGGGLPIGAFGGHGDIMKQVAPQGPIYQAGTLSGNPIAVAAGLSVLHQIEAPGFYERLASNTSVLAQGLREAARSQGIKLEVNQVCGMIGLFFGSQSPVRSYRQVACADSKAYAKFFHAMLRRGVYLAPSAFETMFVSAAHGEDEISQTLSAASESFAEVA